MYEYNSPNVGKPFHVDTKPWLRQVFSLTSAYCMVSEDEAYTILFYLFVLLFFFVIVDLDIINHRIFHFFLIRGRKVCFFQLKMFPGNSRYLIIFVDLIEWSVNLLLVANIAHLGQSTLQKTDGLILRKWQNWELKTHDEDTKNYKDEQHGPHQRPDMNPYAHEGLAVSAFCKTSAK